MSRRFPGTKLFIQRTAGELSARTASSVQGTMYWR